jgi:hypothetical protein
MAPALLLAVLALDPASGALAPTLPLRIQRIVLHTLGGPFYSEPERRWAFFSPPETLRLWKRPTFGAHWIVGADGSIWPRHPAPGGPASYRSASLDPETAARLAREAAPVYSHVAGANSSSVGIELAHSGRRDDPFPDVQSRAAAWLVASLLEMSGGRLGPEDVLGHKDLDRKPAYVGDQCRGRACLAYVDANGRPFRRRVDPPEALFEALAREGLRVPREASEGDLELRRSEAIPASEVPKTAHP